MMATRIPYVDRDASTSGGTQSQLNFSFSAEDRQKLVSDVVFYFLTQAPKNVPITKGEIFKAVEVSDQSKELQEDILRKAIKKLDNVFGITAKHLSYDKQGFVLFNKLDQDLEHIEWTDQENAVRGFLTSLLSLIFMSDGVLKEDQLVLFLTQMNLYGDTTNEDTIATRELIAGPGGNVKQFLEQDLAGKQRYIAVRKIDGSGPENSVHEYRWGERANLEVKKSSILRHVSMLYKRKVSSFRKQYEQVKEEEGPDVFDSDESGDEEHQSLDF